MVKHKLSVIVGRISLRDNVNQHTFAHLVVFGSISSCPGLGLLERISAHCCMDTLLLRQACGGNSVSRTNDSLPCGGPAKGQCVCGKCECNPVLVTGDTSKRYRGKYCQCNDYSCDHYEKMICGGGCVFCCYYLRQGEHWWRLNDCSF